MSPGTNSAVGPAFAQTPEAGSVQTYTPPRLALFPAPLHCSSGDPATIVEPEIATEPPSASPASGSSPDSCAVWVPFAQPQSAVQGDPFAEASLGLLYQFGKGLKRDPVLALMLAVGALSRSFRLHKPDGSLIFDVPTARSAV